MEADTCLECGASKGPDPVPEVSWFKKMASALSASPTPDDDPKLDRELRFYRYMDEERVSDSLGDFKRRLQNTEKLIEENSQQLRQIDVAGKLLDQLASGHPIDPPLSRELRNLIGNQLSSYRRVQAIFKNILEVMKSDPSRKTLYDTLDGRMVQASYEEAQKIDAEDSALIDKLTSVDNFLADGEKSKTPPTPDEKLKEAIAKTKLSIARTASDYSKPLERLTMNLEPLRSKLAELEHAKKSSDQPSSAEKRKMLKKFEAVAKDKTKDLRKRSQFKDCGLTEAELWAIFDYTGSGYDSINPPLLKGDTEAKSVQAYVDVLNSGLEKLSVYQGKVVRGARLPAEVLKQHTEGAVVTYPSYTSTTVGTIVFPGYRFVIYSKTGRYLAPFSTDYDEHEVLFRPGTRFKILKRTQQANGQIEFILDEVGE